MKKVFIFSFIGLILFSACKKSTDDDVISLHGKWTVENFFYNKYKNGLLINTYTNSVDDKTVNFLTNGSLIIATAGADNQSLPCTIRNSTIEFDGSIYYIKDLTASSATLYLGEDYGAKDYDELIINLKRKVDLRNFSISER